MVALPHGRGGVERGGGLVPPHGSTNYKLSCRHDLISGHQVIRPREPNIMISGSDISPMEHLCLLILLFLNVVNVLAADFTIFHSSIRRLHSSMAWLLAFVNAR